MDILRAAESRCRARMDEQAYIMNVCYQLPNESSLETFMDALSEYSDALNELRVLEQFRSQATENNEVKDNPTGS